MSFDTVWSDPAGITIYAQKQLIIKYLQLKF